MNKLILVIFSAVIFAFGGFAFFASAHGHGNEGINEAESGQIVFEKLQAKQIECKDISSEDFHNIGEYFMERMMGTNHEAMNQTMKQMMGQEAEEQMHLVMGKRMSGCDLSAQYPGQAADFMTTMMTGMGTRGFGGGIMGTGGMMSGTMPGFSGGWFWFSAIFMILIWVLILTLLILGLIALIKYLKK